MKYSTQVVMLKRILKTTRRQKNKILLFFIFIIFSVSIYLYGNDKLKYLSLFHAYIFFVGMPIYMFIILECKKVLELFVFLVGTYLALFTFSWAKYEFSINREFQLRTIVTSLIPSENRKNCSRLLSKITQSKIEKEPNILSFENVIYTAANISDKVQNVEAIEAVSVFLNQYSDWSNSDLVGLNMQGKKLENINFTNAILIGANFSNATLINVDFENTKLWNVSFEKATIKDCNFRKADLRKSSLKNAKISKTSFEKSRMNKADLFKTSFSNVSFEDADLRETSFILNNSPHNGEMDNDSFKKIFESFLHNAKTLYNAKIPPQIEKELKKEYPRLFENPDGEKNIKKDKNGPNKFNIPAGIIRVPNADKGSDSCGGKLIGWLGWVCLHYRGTPVQRIMTA